MSSRDNVFIDTDKRVFYLHDEIDEDSISKINYNLLFLLDEDNEKENKEKDFKRKPIKLYINSNGGYTQDMWSLVDIILNSKTSIYTYSTGYAHSSGFLIFIAGHKRFITKHTKMLLHQFNSSISGTYQHIKEKIEDFDKSWEYFEEYILNQTKITKERLKEVREKKLDWYIYSDELIKLGIADKFIKEF